MFFVRGNGSRWCVIYVLGDAVSDCRLLTPFIGYLDLFQDAAKIDDSLGRLWRFDAGVQFPRHCFKSLRFHYRHLNESASVDIEVVLRRRDRGTCVREGYCPPGPEMRLWRYELNLMIRKAPIETSLVNLDLPLSLVIQFSLVHFSIMHSSVSLQTSPDTSLYQNSGCDFTFGWHLLSNKRHSGNLVK